jgi:hypothetical protein
MLRVRVVAAISTTIGVTEPAKQAVVDSLKAFENDERLLDIVKQLDFSKESLVSSRLDWLDSQIQCIRQRSVELTYAAVLRDGFLPESTSKESRFLKRAHSFK